VIVDTNALSAIVDEKPGITEALFRADPAAIPVIVLGEYRFGIAQSRKRPENEKWLVQSLPLYEVLDVTGATTEFYAELRIELKRAGTPIPSNDLWIAALARQHRYPVLSRDTHFDLVPGIRRVTW
jgi:tRNA(fMet)-specific endonuclease VapC